MTYSLGVLPKMYQERYGDLHQHRIKVPSLIQVANKGQLAILGTYTRGSSFNELVRALFVASQEQGKHSWHE